MSSNWIKLTGLWRGKSKDGVDFLSGKYGIDGKLLIFKNKNKRPNSNDPDYTAFIVPAEPKEKPTNSEQEEF